MFEDRTYEALLEEALAKGEDLGVDTRQGSIYFDAISGILFKVAKLYSDLDMVFEMVFLDSSTDEFLDMRAQEHGLTRNPATCSRYEAFFQGAVPVPGERFFCDNLYFVLVQEDVSLYFQSEEAGSATGNIAPGTSAVPENTIDGLTSALFGELIESGSDAESDQSLRTRTKQKISGPAENGNRQHYKTWCEQVPGIGRARVVPLWNGPNTVKGILLDTQGQPAPAGLVESVQNYIDPGSEGLGEGMANIGAYFTAAPAVRVDIYVSFDVTLASGKTLSDAKAEATEAIGAYLKALALESPEDENLVVRLSNVGAILYALPSVIDYFGLTLNGKNGNIPIDNTQVAILGEVNVNAI